jgi:hypothetical protein
VLPQPPDELLEAGGGYQIEYDSPMSRARRAEEGIAIQRSFEQLAPMAQVAGAERALPRVNFDELSKVVFEVNGAPARILYDDDEMKVDQPGGRPAGAAAADPRRGTGGGWRCEGSGERAVDRRVDAEPGRSAGACCGSRVSPYERYRRLRDSFRACFERGDWRDDAGALTKHAARVLTELRIFCRADESTFDPDARVHAYARVAARCGFAFARTST